MVPFSSSASSLAMVALDAFIVVSATRRVFSSFLSSSSIGPSDRNLIYRWTESASRKKPLRQVGTVPSCAICWTRRADTPSTVAISVVLTSVSSVIFSLCPAI